MEGNTQSSGAPAEKYSTLHDFFFDAVEALCSPGGKRLYMHEYRVHSRPGLAYRA
jgi:hypothetical protein